MRIGVTSDIHTDISPANHQIVNHLVDAVRRAELDVFIICGDISPNIFTLSDTLSAFHNLRCKKLYVAGNHDIWIINSTDKTTSHQKHALITKICEENSFHHLGDSSIVIEHIGFCGTIGWYDYSYKSDRYPIPELFYKRKTFQGSVWNDVNYARWKLPDPEIERQLEDELQEQIDSIRDQVSRIIVVTHHVPFRECVVYQDKLPWDFFSAFMGSEKLGEICFNEPLVTHVLFGHTHTEFYKEVKAQESGLSRSIWAVCSPIGYLTDPPKNLKEYARSRLKIIDLVLKTI